jgi:hypothetical protein
VSHKSDEGLGLQPLERLPAFILGVVGFGIAVGELWHLYHFITDVAGSSGDPIHTLASYVWTSFGTLIILGWIATWYYHRLGIRVGELRVREAAIQLQHKLAEEVRRCAADPQRYEWADFELASGQIKQFLAQRLPGVGCSITIKMIEGAQLRAVFRDCEQDRTQRSVGNLLPLHDSHVYRSFRAIPRGQKRWVYVRDTENVADRSYAERAKACGFRSVAAFPLREPVEHLESPTPHMGIDVAGLLGFWSLDANEPDAFIDLFRADRLKRHHDNDGKGLEPRADIQAFYGIADCIATILMLKQTAAAAKTEGPT